MGQRIWLFPVWLTAVGVDIRQDLTSLFIGKNPQLYKNSLVDCQHEHALVATPVIRSITVLDDIAFGTYVQM